MHAFLGLGDSAVFHCMLCLFRLGLYWKIQVTSSVMICLRISGLSLIFFSMSSQNFTWFCFWSSDKILAPFWHTPFASPDHAERLSALILCLGSVHVISYVLSICNHFTQQLPSSVVFIFPIGRSSRLGIILHFLVAFPKMFMSFKDLRSRHLIFTINLFKKFKTLSWFKIHTSSFLLKTSS